MSLELRKGIPTLLVDYGSETISIKPKKKISDGNTHSINIFLKPGVIYRNKEKANERISKYKILFFS